MILDQLFSWANSKDQSLELMRFTETISSIAITHTTQTFITPVRDRMFLVMSYAVHCTPELNLFCNYAELILIDPASAEHVLWATQPARASSGAGAGVEPATVFGGASWPLIVPPGYGLRSRAGFASAGGGAIPNHRSIHYVQGIQAPRATLL